MARIVTSARFAEATLGAAKRFNRRTVLKTGAAAGAVTVAGPFFLRQALAAGEVNILMWSDYLPESFVKGFEEKTGIKINFTGIGSNEQILNKLRATRGEGFDICSPTASRAPQWAKLEVLQPIDMERVPIDKVNPAMTTIGEKAWNFGGKGSHSTAGSFNPFYWVRSLGRAGRQAPRRGNGKRGNEHLQQVSEDERIQAGFEQLPGIAERRHGQTQPGEAKTEHRHVGHQHRRQELRHRAVPVSVGGIADDEGGNYEADEKAAGRAQQIGWPCHGRRCIGEHRQTGHPGSEIGDHRGNPEP